MPSGRMTKMHFIAIANTLAAEKPPTPGERYNMHGEGMYDQWVSTVKSFAAMCQASSPLFDRQRFYAACGFEE